SRACPADVMVPKRGDTTFTVRLGWLKFAWFMRLNTSQRNCRLNRSSWPKRVFLETELSQLNRPGPMMMFRPAEPNRNEPVARSTNDVEVVPHAGLRESTT